MKKFFLALLIVSLVVGMLAGCGSPGGAAQTTTSAGSQSSTSTDGQGGSDKEITLILWHDKGDSGIKMFDEVAAIQKQDYPNLVLEQVSYSSADFISKSIVAINSNSSPDLLFNDYFRIIPIEQQTQGLLDLTPYITDEHKGFIDKNAMLMGQYNGKQLVYPDETTFLGLGIRKSWLNAVNGKVPETLDEFAELAYKFTYEDPDSNGKDDTFGFAAFLNSAGAQEFVGYLTYGAGINDVTTDATGVPTFNEDKRKSILKLLAKMYNTDKTIPTDSINHTYTEMYQYIEGNKVGMFRVGDWNLNSWDKMFGDDLILTNWPVLNKGDKPNAYFYSMRGIAIPANGKNIDAAVDFARVCDTLEGQAIHYKYFRGVVRNDIKVDSPTQNENYFIKDIHDPSHYKMIYTDTHFALLPFVPEINEIYQKAIQKILIDKDADVDTLLNEAETQAKQVYEKNKTS